MTKELNNKNISLNKYKENVNKLDNEYKKEIQELKKELKESKEYIDSDKKDKDKVIKKIVELSKEQQKYINEKQIIEQELNKKEQELANNKKIINDLNIKIKSLKDDDKLMEDFKKDSLPKYNEKLNRLKNLENEYQKIYIPNLNELLDIERDPTKLKKVDAEKIKRNLKDGEFYKYELNISDSRIKYFDKIIKENPKMSAKKIDILNQLKSLYTTRKDFFKIKIYNPKSKTPDLRSLDDEIRKLEYEFRKQKGSRTFTYQNKFVKLLTLLTQLFAKNTAHNSKKLKDDINQMLKKLYNSKQIIKQV